MKVFVIAATLALTSSTAYAGCIGPVIMGKCQGAMTDNYGNATRSNRARVGANTYVNPNAYGMGTGSDHYGRPVRHNPLWNGSSRSIFHPNGLANIWGNN